MKVLTIHFSQSGQLTTIVNNFVSELSGVEIEQHVIVPKNNYPFPWTVPVFFDVMPETVLEKEIELETIPFQCEKYDLIIIGYQPWFLSPSLPVTSLLKDIHFKEILKNTPVITLIGSRNMWLNSQESVKKLIKAAGGKLMGNVALADRSDNLAGVVTILHWMLTGKKTKKWGIFPMPGVSDQDIEGVKLFGQLTNSALHDNTLEQLQEQIITKDGVIIRTNILFIEGKAKRLFIIWANLISKKSNRSFWVNAFKYYLIFVLFVVSPIILIVYNLLILPFTFFNVKKKKAYFQQVELK